MLTDELVPRAPVGAAGLLPPEVLVPKPDQEFEEDQDWATEIPDGDDEEEVGQTRCARDPDEEEEEDEDADFFEDEEDEDELEEEDELEDEDFEEEEEEEDVDEEEEEEDF